MNTHEITKAIRNHASTYYNVDGWDILVECFSDEDIRDELLAQGLLTLPEALLYFNRKCRLLDDRRKEIAATEF